MNLNVIAPINTLSYGYTSYHLIKELSRSLQVSLFPIGPIEVDNKDSAFIGKALENSKSFDYNAPSLKIWHQFHMADSVGRGLRIGLTIFELNSLTDVEVHHLNSLDHILVPSKWALNVCKNSGITSPVHVLNLGVNTNIFKPIEIEPYDKFTILNIGKWEIRKGHDILPYLLSSTFSKRDDVKLIMVPYNPFIGPKGNEKWKSYYKNTVNIELEILDRLESQHDLANLINKCHVGLFPARTEGWNLPLLEMMACGKHVVTTNVTAHTEFCNLENSKLVNLDKTETAYDGLFFKGQGNWYTIDDQPKIEMCNHIRELYEMYQRGDSLINQNGIETARRFTWSRSASQFIEYLNQWKS